MPTSAKRHGQVLVAGPGSSVSIPGLVVAEVAHSLSTLIQVVRLEVDPDPSFISGLHRARPLTTVHPRVAEIPVLTMPPSLKARQRQQHFAELLRNQFDYVVAYAWTGIDNRWISQFTAAAASCSLNCAVLYAIPPRMTVDNLRAIADEVEGAGLLVVGDADTSTRLGELLGPDGPRVEWHRAIALGERRRLTNFTVNTVTAFLPRDDVDTLTTLLAAFDAIPDQWIQFYRLRVIMRYSGSTIERLVGESHHADWVELAGRDLDDGEVEVLVGQSSAVVVADPTLDSRVFNVATYFGVATVVLLSSNYTAVGDGYVGGLVADARRPPSVHVALMHALRIAELIFPQADSWPDLAARIHRFTFGDDAISDQIQHISR